MKIGNFGIAFKTQMKQFYILPKRLTMDHSEAIYRWFWFNFSFDENVK